MRQAQQGDMEALHFLYARYAPDVLCHVRDLVPDDHEAEDIMQNVFRESMALIEKYEARKEPFIDWLLDIAHDTALEHAGKGHSVTAREKFSGSGMAERLREDRRHERP